MQYPLRPLALLLTAAGLLPSAHAADPVFTFPESGLKVKDRVTLLAIDDNALRDREGLTLTLSKPNIRKEPVLTPKRGIPGAPDSIAAHFYGTVLHDQGKFRMWYYAVSHDRNAEQELKQGPVCYAESVDGLKWTTPNLGQVEINGSTDNNAIELPDEITQCAAVIIDEDDPDPDRRYKMLYVARAGTWLFRPATSPDGIHWSTAPEFPTETFLEMGSFFKFGDRYIAHGQGIGQRDGVEEGRQGYASTSTDFAVWDKKYLDAYRAPEPEDVTKRGLLGDYPQVHLGVGTASFGNVAVGLWGIWHNPSEADRRKTGWYGAGLITCDLGLVVSNDGVAFREPVTGHVFISEKDSPATPVPGVSDPTILCQANGILNVGDLTYIYHGRWRNATETKDNYYAEVGLATLPKDRWGSLSLSESTSSGTVWSAPITIPEGGVTISLNTNRADNITVELADANGTLLPEYSAEKQGDVQVAKANESAVHWADTSLEKLGGQTIRIKLKLKGDDTRLYAVYLEANR
jgi:hypothetical protein